MRKKKEKKIAEDFYAKWDGYAKKRSAWSEYVSVMHTQKLIKEERDYLNGTPETKKVIEEKRKNRSDQIYIG